ncbi:MAG TPA: type VI secretion system domain-containing protein, partial [Longimicrobiaceae bacterium]|nr:type VI secretion system domain-containing protein [Longimicrobiaceae bacterium]
APSAADANPSSGGAVATPVSGSDAAGGVAAAARFMRSENPTNPAPYLMLRGYRWGELRVRGEDIDPKLLVAPATEARTRLKTLLLDEKWADPLNAAEEVMATPSGRGWLDLQRYVMTACEGLGSEYDFVAAALRSALAALVRDLPALTTLTLMDDSPTANPETMAWLVSEGICGEPADAGADQEVGTRQRARRGPTERAMELVKAGQPQAAVDILMREAAKEGSSRSAFLRRSEAASVMVDAGVHAVAMPLLTELVEQIDQHQLERWEDGETIARPLGLLYLCMQKLEGEESGQDLYLRICRLDPLQAIRLGSQTNGRSGD